MSDAEIGTAMVESEETAIQEVEVPAGPVDLARVMQLAERGVDPDTVGKMVDLYEKVHGIQAKQEFNRAMLAIQKHMATHRVPMRGIVVVSKQGVTKPYALLEDIQRVLNPVCFDNGISYGFDTEATGKAFLVTMTIRHVTGHSEDVRTTLPLDDSGSKNMVQGVGSTESYGMRYCAIKGFALPRFMLDDDGVGTPTEPKEVEPVNEEQLANLSAVWDEVVAQVDEPAFFRYFECEKLADMPASSYDEALGMLERKRA